MTGRKIRCVIVILLQTIVLLSQKADVIEGCLPLKVKFTSNVQSQYYWDFNDGGVALVQNPEHIFTKAGTYKVKLKDTQNGVETGQITISVYEKPSLSIVSDIAKGCVPLNVKFDVDILANEAIKISEYKWTFGDGATITGQKPSHLYTKGGKYDVSLGIKTNFEGCDVTKIFPEYIEAFSVNADFNIVAISECQAPYTYDIKNTTIATQGNFYQWELGNGQTSDKYDPGIQKFDQSGSYIITLKVTDRNGCMDTLSQTLAAGKPSIKLSLKRDSICISERVVVSNTGTGTNIKWTFDASASIPNSTLRQPQWHYNTPGLKTVKYTAGTGNECLADTTFTIYVEPKPNAAFTFTPEIGCHNPHVIDVIADDLSHNKYFWQKSTKATSPIEKVIITDPKRDSLYMHYRDTIFLFLTVHTAIGCQASSRDTAFVQRPDAYFVTTEPKGCVPLAVTFMDRTYTHVPIKKIQWVFGDGQSITQNGNGEVKHTYTKPGEYYARSIIENLEGCIDTSASLVIKVGNYIKPSLAIDKTEICLGDSISVQFTNTEPQIDAYHLSTDDYRFSHCWSGKSASHRFVTAPGTYPVIASIDYNGCLTKETLNQVITVKGAKANIGYMIDCTDPLNVMFDSKSINETELTWSIQDSLINLDTFRYRFAEKGDFVIKLIANNVIDQCPADTTSIPISLRQVKAYFELNDKYCDTDTVILSGIKSIDVDNDCSKGYLWKFTHERPIETPKSSVITLFPGGRQTVQLIVEDLNGCRDTMTRNTESFGIYPKINANDTEFCVPFNLQINDLSTSDAKIKSWEWSTGEKTQNLSTTITEDFDIKKVILKLTDIHGCADTVSVLLHGYKPTSVINVWPQNTICLGNPLNFIASDFTDKGSKLSFNWNFGDNQTEKTQNPIHTYQKTGIYKVVLDFQEVSTGCKDTIQTSIKVIQPPKALFTSSEDNNAVVCHPKIIDFNNESKVDGEVIYTWQLGKNNSILTNPSEAFGKGKHNVTLYVHSPYGCSDTISKEYTLVGPEGIIVKDKSTLCTGENVTLSLGNKVDVSQWTWQFSDGKIIENLSPVTKSFDPTINEDYVTVNLILKSAENGCNLILTDSIAFQHIIADFTILDTSLCQGLLTFNNLSKNAVSYLWTFDDKNTSTSYNPQYIYPVAGEQKITLVAYGANQICKDTISKDYTMAAFEDLVKFPNVFTPNGDGENDVFKAIIDEKIAERFDILTLKVYNRWGHLVSDGKSWDGNYQGNEAPAEVYAFYMEVLLEDCRTFSKKGNITLIR